MNESPTQVAMVQTGKSETFVRNGEHIIADHKCVPLCDYIQYVMSSPDGAWDWDISGELRCTGGGSKGVTEWRISWRCQSERFQVLLWAKLLTRGLVHPASHRLPESGEKNREREAVGGHYSVQLGEIRWGATNPERKVVECWDMFLAQLNAASSQMASWYWGESNLA